MARYCLNNFTIQCTDTITGLIGCFVFDIERYAQEGKFYATSPIYPSLDALYSSPYNAVLKGVYTEYKGE